MPRKRKTFELMGPRGRCFVEAHDERRAIWQEYGGKNWLQLGGRKAGGWKQFSYPMFNGKVRIPATVAVRQI